MWNFRKKLNNKVFNNKLNEIYDIAMKNVALGVKLIGAGWILFFISNLSNHNIIENKLQEIGFTNINFKFSSHGTTVKIFF